MLSAINSIKNNGFARIDDFFSVNDVTELELILDEAINNKVKKPSLNVDLNRPSRFKNNLLNSKVYEKCELFSSMFFGVKSHYLYDHAIYKYPGGIRNEPHQDQAYLGGGFIFDSLNFWIPLQDTDDTNGTIEYSACNDQIILPHARENNAYVLSDSGSLEVKPIAVNKGGMSVHTSLKIHASGENKSDSVRKAWIVHFGRKSRLSKKLYQIRALFN